MRIAVVKACFFTFEVSLLQLKDPLGINVLTAAPYFEYGCAIWLVASPSVAVSKRCLYCQITTSFIIPEVLMTICINVPVKNDLCWVLPSALGVILSSAVENSNCKINYSVFDQVCLFRLYLL